MPLQPADIAIQFAAGVDTKTDAKQVVIAKLTDLQNAVFLKNGTLSKRNGYASLGTTVDGKSTPYANAQGLAKRGNELLLFAGGNCYSQRPSSTTWDLVAPVSSIVASADPIARTGTDQTVPDVATNDGITVAAWEDSRGGVWYAVDEAVGGRELVAPTQLDSGGSRPRVVAVGNVIHVLWVKSPEIWIAVVNPASPETVPTPAVLTADLDAGNPTFDAEATFDSYDAANRPALVAWTTAGGYRVGFVHPSGVLGSPVTGLPTPGTWTVPVTGPIACAFWTSIPSAQAGTLGFGAGVLFDAGGATGLYARLFFGDFVTDYSSLAGTVYAITPWARCTCVFSEDTAGNPILWWAGESGSGNADQHYVVTGNVAGTGAVGAIIRGHGLASRAFYDNNQVFVSLVHPVLYFPYVAVCQLSTGTVLTNGILAGAGGSVLAYTNPPPNDLVTGYGTQTNMRCQARLLPGLSSGLLGRSLLPSVFPLNLGASGATSRQHGLALGYRIQLSGTSGTQFGEQGIYQFTLDYEHDDAYRWAELGRGVYLSGALLQHYDGDRWAENSFHAAPDTYNGTIVTSHGAGGSLTTGQYYGYKILFEEIDGQGELHPGATSIGTIVNLTGGDTKVTLTVPTCRLTSKRRVRIGVFRSLAAATAPDDPDAIPYYRVSSVDPTAVGDNGYLLNDPSVDSISFSDALADATVATLEPLYTNGGILSNDPEQSGGENIVGGKNRLFWPDPLDGNLVNHSQEIRDDTAAEMSAALSVRIDPFGGDVVAIAVMDDNVIVFKETAIFAFGGPGPAADGSTTTQAWSPPQLVTSDVGCKSRSSVANVPLGVVFQSDKGIYLLGRDLQVKRIGDDVWAYRNQRVSRATLLPDRPQIVFLTDVDQGRTLLFDYDREAWSTFTNHVGLDAVVANGSYYYLRANGEVWQETQGSYRDGTQHIPMAIETAWIKLSAALQGWQKIHRVTMLGNYLSPHTLRMLYRLDYEPAWSAPLDHDMGADQDPSNYGAGNYGAGTYQPGAGVQSVVYQRQYHLNKRGQSIMFHFEDLESDPNYGAAFELSELLLTGGIVGRVFRPGAARQG